MPLICYKQNPLKYRQIFNAVVGPQFDYFENIVNHLLSPEQCHLLEQFIMKYKFVIAVRNMAEIKLAEDRDCVVIEVIG